MTFSETPLAGAYVVELEKLQDERGFFARMFCAREFEAHGLEPRVAQGNMSFSRRKGTLRGMHYQVAPAEETKLVRCIGGAIYDVIIDVREDSETYLQHFGLELSADNRKALFVPRGFAHGCLSLEDDTEILYLVSEFYTPGHERGLRWDDPALGIEWPVQVTEVSDKDGSWPLVRDQAVG